MAKLASQFVALPPQRRALAFAQTAARMAALDGVNHRWPVVLPHEGMSPVGLSFGHAK
jgi:hypothetical protein